MLYKHFDLVLFTSDWEGMPITMWEAMVNGVPVIAPDVGGFKEILEENNCGLIYEPGNLTDAEDKLLKLLDNKELITLLGKNGRTAIENNTQRKSLFSKLKSLFRSND